MYTDVFTKGSSSDACVPTGKLLGINDIVLISMLNLERLLVREISIIRKNIRVCLIRKMIMTCTEKLKFSGEMTMLQIFPFWGGEGGGGRGCLLAERWKHLSPYK